VQLEKYLKLPQNGKVIAEYIWIDGSNGLRSKCKVSMLNSSYKHCATRRQGALRHACANRGSGQGVAFGRFLIDTLR
jgi:hypothetical protein